MFVWSIRASTLKFFTAILASAFILCLLVVLVPVSGGEAEGQLAATEERVNYEAKDKSARISFLSDCGWQVGEASEVVSEMTLPMEFDSVFAGYNEIQRAQGMDLSDYKGKKLQCYTYTVTNYEGYSGKVQATLLVYRDTIVGADVCSEASDGFVHGIFKK